VPIVDFLKRFAEPASTEITTPEQHNAFKAKNIAVIGYFEPGSAEADEFLRTADVHHHESYEFGLVTDRIAAPTATFPSLVLYKQFDEPEIVYTGEFTQGGIGKFVDIETTPWLGEIGPANYQQYLQRGQPLAWLFVGSDKAVLDVVKEVAKEFRTFSFVQLDGKQWADHGKNMGLTSTTPGFVVVQEKKKFVLNEAITVESVRALVQSISAGTATPTVKSEPVPEDNDGPVFVVVGSTFEAIVLDPTQDVFVEFYAPWCGHCKTLTPKFEKVGDHFSEDKTVKIAKVDATANDTPADISGFPTLLFYPKASKSQPIVYEGDRETDKIVAWIEEHRSPASA